MAEVSKNNRDLIILVILQRFLAAAFALLGTLALFVFVALPIIMIVEEPMVTSVSLAIMGFVALLLLAAAVVSVAVGLGLVKRKAWARWGEIVLSALGLLSFPIGTIIGGLVLVYLLSEDGQAQFEA